jgi:shikimate dehydrogenase
VSPAAPTSLYGLIGLPVVGNPTQEMLEAAFAAAGLDARYASFEVRAVHLADAVRGLRALGFHGAHVTVPHKVQVLPLLERLTSAAALAGAVNCIKRDEDLLVGDNTDGSGFVDSLRGLRDPAGAIVAVIGAGGAARAIVAELALSGAARIIVVNRTARRAADIAERIGAETGVECEPVQLTDPWVVPGDVQVVVNATTVGMVDPGERIAVDWSQVGRGAIAADVVISPSTAFLREAEARGHQPLNGLEMLVEQAVIGFRWWTGIEPDKAVMRSALERELGLG